MSFAEIEEDGRIQSAGMEERNIWAERWAIRLPGNRRKQTGANAPECWIFIPAYDTGVMDEGHFSSWPRGLKMSMPKAEVKASVRRRFSAVSSRIPRPGVMSKIRSERARARSSSWVEMRMVLPCSWARVRRRRRINMRCGRSRCAVGSSSRMISVC